MPRWICPTCQAAMSVKASLIGEERPCVKCGAVAEVIDADVTEELRPTGTTVARMLAALTAGLGVVLLCVGEIAGAGWAAKEAFAAFSIKAVAAIVLLWPVYVMVDDTRACRRLLEILANRRGG